MFFDGESEPCGTPGPRGTRKGRNAGRDETWYEKEGNLSLFWGGEEGGARKAADRDREGGGGTREQRFSERKRRNALNGRGRRCGEGEQKKRRQKNKCAVMPTESWVIFRGRVVRQKREGSDDAVLAVLGKK